MQLFFLRHAQAGTYSGNAQEDFHRPLTQTGIDHTHRLAALLKQVNVKPDYIFSSPLKRAHQTAEIVGGALGVAVEIREALAPGFRPSDVAALIAHMKNDESVMFTGHEPDFSSVVGALIGGGRVVMKKGGLARIDAYSRTPIHGELVWMLAPKLLDVSSAED